ncbi:MAG: hemerythrin domain-containing protein [Thiohalocapsa sp.]|nr:hemerythrin domain-containing protein [Thiohalocapsa sp.]MCF7988875.1 hemerythrin domain-containing protein [Thiohalocapsa sp.]
MSVLLTRLAEDHRRLARLLNLLEALLDRFHSGDEPDYELMCEMLEYMIDYADQVHHPSEDLIFERLLQGPEQGHDVLRRLMLQHDALAGLNRRFRESLEGIVHEEVLRRDEVEQQGRELLGTLREHMVLEDTQAFPLAHRMLTEADWAEIEARAPSVDDPVFGHSDPERFRALYAHLKTELSE